MLFFDILVCLKKILSDLRGIRSIVQYSHWYYQGLWVAVEGKNWCRPVWRRSWSHKWPHRQPPPHTFSAAAALHFGFWHFPPSQLSFMLYTHWNGSTFKLPCEEKGELCQTPIFKTFGTFCRLILFFILKNHFLSLDWQWYRWYRGCWWCWWCRQGPADIFVFHIGRLQAGEPPGQPAC